MGAQVAQLSCSECALELSAAIGLLSCMDAAVASEGATVYCCVITAWLITLIRLLPCVFAPGMDYQSAPLCSSVATTLVAAVERLLPCVGTIVCC